MRATQEANLPETVYVQTLTRTSDGAGGWSETWQTVATVRGRIVTLERYIGEDVVGGAVKQIGDYIITLPVDTEVQETDQLQINSQQYKIMGFVERSQKTALRVYSTKV